MKANLYKDTNPINPNPKHALYYSTVYIKYLSYLLSLTNPMFTVFLRYFPTKLLILTQHVNFPYGRKAENPEKTHDFPHSVFTTLPTRDEMFDASRFETTEPPKPSYKTLILTLTVIPILIMILIDVF